MKELAVKLVGTVPFVKVKQPVVPALQVPLNEALGAAIGSELVIVPAVVTPSSIAELAVRAVEPVAFGMKPTVNPEIVPPPPAPQSADVTSKLPLASVSTHLAAVVAPVQVANCVVFPVRVPTAKAFPPAPITGRFDVNAEAFVLQVVQVIVPAPVIVPPPIGPVVATLVTAVPHVPSPRQKWLLSAFVPLPKFVTGRFPVTSAVNETKLLVTV